MTSKLLLSRPTGLLFYAAAAALALFELAALTMALRPQVSEAYRAYFITRTTNCWPNPKSPYRYELGSRLFLTVDAKVGDSLPMLGCGWGSPEAWGTWTLGPRADMHLSIQPPSSDVTLRAVVQPFVGQRKEQEVKVSADGIPVAVWTIPAGEPRELTARIPQPVTSDGDVRVTFDIVYPSSPRDSGLSTDARKLGMWVSWISISPAP
jgi:hypothetical protein